MGLPTGDEDRSERAPQYASADGLVVRTADRLLAWV